MSSNCLDAMVWIQGAPTWCYAILTTAAHFTTFTSRIFHDWAVCQIAHNCSVNKLIATLMEIPHVGCANHRVHLEVRKKIKSDTSLSSTIDTVHDVMRSCKQKLRNRGLPPKSLNLSPVLNNETRCRVLIT